MTDVWSNWSGSVKFTPGALYEPSSEEELQKIVQKAIEEKKTVRAAGAGHSSTPLVVTKDVVVSLKQFREVDQVDMDHSTAWVGTGLTVKEGGSKLLEHGLSLHNTGDVDIQCIAGAISTGTHGTGIRLRTLSAMLIGCRMICADGEIREFTETKEGKDFFDAMRVSMGTFGIMTKMKLQLMPAFRLDRREWCTHTDNVLEHLDELIGENRNFDFYWYPRSDLVKLRILNEPGKGMQQLDFAEQVENKTGWAIEVLPKERDLKFDEIEYALPLEAGPECFREVRKRIKEKYREKVTWRLLYRTIQADDFFISPFFGRDTATISLHQNAGIPFMEYFQAFEPIFRDFGGRPHWGKKHTLQSREISSLFPRWNDFLEYRHKMDPQGVFLNEHLKSQIFDL